MYRISVLTSTYNRAEMIPRLYASLEASTFRNFEWVVVNDGSTDSTNLIMEDIVKKSTFTINYLNGGENLGKHIRMNQLLLAAKGTYCFFIDDDDELLPDAMEKGLAVWDNIPKNERVQYWSVCGHCIDSITRERIGNDFREAATSHDKDLPGKGGEVIRGEKCAMHSLNHLREFKMPEVKGVHFIPEDYLWNRLNEKYFELYVNINFRVYHCEHEKSLTRPDTTSTDSLQSQLILAKFMLNDSYCRPKDSCIYHWYIRSIYSLRKKLKVSWKETFAGMKATDKIAVLSVPISPYMIKCKAIRLRNIFCRNISKMNRG